MSTKDFKAGMAAGAKPFGDKLDQLAGASEKGINDIREGIDGVHNVVDVILDDLSAQEKKRLYDLNTVVDISELDDTEKEYLCAVLFAVAARVENPTQEQQKYLRSLKAYLSIVNVQRDIDLSSIENIESITTQKAILQTVMEFLFLGYQSHDYMDDYEDIFDYFSVNRKGIREIQDGINAMYQRMGIEGIAEHYGPVVEPAQIVGEAGNLPTDNGVCLDHYGLVEAVGEDIVIDAPITIIEAGAEQLFENKKITISEQLCVKGTAIFRNCEVICNYDGAVPAIYCADEASKIEFIDCEFICTKQPQITVLGIEGQCLMQNCLIDGQKYQHIFNDEAYHDNDGDAIGYYCSFIDVDGYDETASLTMEHCNIKNCEGTFINADGNSLGNNFKVVIKDCLVEAHTGNFLHARYATTSAKTGVIIENTTFVDIASPDYESAGIDEWDYYSNHARGLLVAECIDFSCIDSVFKNISDSIFNASNRLGGSMELRGCQFSNISQEIKTYGIIDGCAFDNIEASISFGEVGLFGNSETIVKNSDFLETHGKVALEYGKMEHCHFTKCLTGVRIIGKGNGSDSYTSEATDVTFEECTVGEEYTSQAFGGKDGLLVAGSYLDKNKECVAFYNCKFKNCHVPQDQLMITAPLVYPSFGRAKPIKIGREYNTVIE